MAEISDLVHDDEKNARLIWQFRSISVYLIGHFYSIKSLALSGTHFCIS